MALKRALWEAWLFLLDTREEEVGGRGDRRGSLSVSSGGEVPSADLGGSSDYTSVTLVDGRGERFRVNRDGTRVSRG
jgi:hypothetical protein